MTIQDILSQANIAEYISQYIDLSEKNGELWGLSCFKTEQTPSFSVNPEKGVFMDFSSGKSGNILNFIMDYNQCSFQTAINILKEWLNIEDETIYTQLPIVAELKKYKRKQKKEPKTTHTILSLAELSLYDYNNCDWWEKEGIAKETCMKYHIGHDIANECITIPIWDNNGNLINILRRTLNPQAKEIGLPKYIYKYKMGAVDFIWGWHDKISAIKEHGEYLLVEGVKSVLKIEQMGYENAGALMTSHLNDHQLKLLVGLGVDCVFLLDKDADPRSDQNIQKLKRFCRVYVAEDKEGLLSAKDSPCDKGEGVFRQILDAKGVLK